PPVVARVLGRDVAGSHVVQRGLRVDQLTSGVRQHGAQFVVLQRGGAAYLHAAERVYHLREAGEVDGDEAVDAQTGELLDFLHQTLRSAEGERRVQFRLGVDVSGTPLLGVRVVERAVLTGVWIPRLTLDGRDGQIARKRHCDNTFTVCRDVDQHDGVRSGAARVLGAAGAHLAVGPGARVHTH